jgi:hypothetical protein
MLAVCSPWKHPRYKPTEECPLPLGRGTFGLVYWAKMVVAAKVAKDQQQVTVKIIQSMQKREYMEAF